MADLLRVIYSSQPFGFDEASLNGILRASRRNNLRDGITGALVCRADLYLQLLEGPEKEVEAAFERIGKDDRHLGVKLHSRGLVGARLFPAWAMRDDPPRSWMWTAADVAGGARDRAAPHEILAIFTRLASEAA